MELRDYTFLGTTRSLCPHCRRLVDAKIVVRAGRVYFRKRCPEHGLVEDFVCSDVAYYDRHEFDQPARRPRHYGTAAGRGCPYDCGLCPEHEQHTCIALVEVTSSCNLRCPLCFAESGPGVSYQLATYCGRHVDPGDLERRATMPDVAKALVAQTGGLLAADDFYPLPCAHPNCHLLAYLYRGGGAPVPISRIIDVRKHMDLIANSIVYTPARARQLVASYLDGAGGCGCGPGGCGTGQADPSLDEFVGKALAEKLSGSDVFRVTLTGFLDAHTFDTRRVMKCCLAHLLPSGHVVPFCAYNTLYRDGHVPLPPLADGVPAAPRSLPLVSC